MLPERVRILFLSLGFSRNYLGYLSAQNDSTSKCEIKVSSSETEDGNPIICLGSISMSWWTGKKKHRQSGCSGSVCTGQKHTFLCLGMGRTVWHLPFLYCTEASTQLGASSGHSLRQDGSDSDDQVHVDGEMAVLIFSWNTAGLYYKGTKRRQ